MTRLDSSGNKYHSVRTWSELCQRWFSSKAEAKRGEQLKLLEKAGEIEELKYQVKFILCNKPRCSIKVDFAYLLNGEQIYEDVKGAKETREFRVKRLWAKEKFGIDIALVR